MTPIQRAAAERLIADQSSSNLEWSRQVSDLLRELAFADPTDPGHDVEVLREHVRHLERRLRELAAEPLGEPVAWIDSAGQPHHISAVQTATERRLYGAWMPVFAAPQQRKPLTDEQINEMALQEQFLLVCDDIEALTEIARAVERAHGIKETP